MENIFHRFLASRLFICLVEASFLAADKSSVRSIQLFYLSTTTALPALVTSWPHPGWPCPALAASWPHSGWPRPALVASRPDPGWPHYHLSLMILPQHSSSEYHNKSQLIVLILSKCRSFSEFDSNHRSSVMKQNHQTQMMINMVIIKRKIIKNKSLQSADFCCFTLKRWRISKDLSWGKIIKLRW